MVPKLKADSEIQVIHVKYEAILPLAKGRFINILLSLTRGNTPLVSIIYICHHILPI